MIQELKQRIEELEKEIKWRDKHFGENIINRELNENYNILQAELKIRKEQLKREEDILQKIDEIKSNYETMIGNHAGNSFIVAEEWSEHDFIDYLKDLKKEIE